MRAPSAIHEALDSYWTLLALRKASGEYTITFRLVEGELVGKIEHNARETTRIK